MPPDDLEMLTLPDEEKVLCLDALASIVCESTEAEVVRLAITALINTRGGVQQLKEHGLAI